MIPLSDPLPTRKLPIVNVSIIIVCTLILLYELSLSAFDVQRFFNDYAVVPASVDAWVHHPHGLRVPSTVISAAFLHGGLLHLGGNMIYLWVFGDNIEDALGHIPYLLFYLACAVGAAALQIAVDTSSTVPMLGASGAIAGVLGAYLLLYPTVPVDVFLFPFLLPIPAWLLIIFWFVLQLVSGLATLGDTSVSSGVAVWAHVGGFATGFALMLAARPWAKPDVRSPKRPARSRSIW